MFSKPQLQLGLDPLDPPNIGDRSSGCMMFKPSLTAEQHSGNGRSLVKALKTRSERVELLAPPDDGRKVV